MVHYKIYTFCIGNLAKSATWDYIWAYMAYMNINHLGDVINGCQQPNSDFASFFAPTDNQTSVDSIFVPSA